MSTCEPGETQEAVLGETEGETGRQSKRILFGFLVECAGKGRTQEQPTTQYPGPEGGMKGGKENAETKAIAHKEPAAASLYRASEFKLRMCRRRLTFSAVIDLRLGSLFGSGGRSEWDRPFFPLLCDRGLFPSAPTPGFRTHLLRRTME